MAVAVVALKARGKGGPLMKNAMAVALAFAVTTLAATAVTLVAEASAAEPVPASRTAAHGSCFFSIRGVLRWCLGPRYGNVWTPSGTGEVRKEGRRYFVSQSDHDHGYVRPADRPGKWRAMAKFHRGWSRYGTITRASGGRYLVRIRGQRLGFARGPWPVAVGAYRLLYGSAFREPVRQ
jgi:hypothetical protein